MGKVVVMDHPLIQHKIGIMRRTDTGSKDFRTLVSEVAMLECYEATRDLELTDVEIETPICKATVKELKGKKLAVVPILRAGLGTIEENRAYVFINKESQRIRKESLNALDGKDVLLVFPTNHKKNSTVRILKTPKTESSVRKIFLPKSVANMLVDWKAEQDEMKEILGDEYMDYNLVMASTFGLPLGDGAIRGPLKKLIEDYNLPPVVFHSFRHSSVTYKLKLNGGDIKAVQGDSGHAQVNMVTDVYSHILDDDRRKNAELFEEAFYEKKNLDPQMHVQQENNNTLLPMKLIRNFWQKSWQIRRCGHCSIHWRRR